MRGSTLVRMSEPAIQTGDGEVTVVSSSSLVPGGTIPPPDPAVDPQAVSEPTPIPGSGATDAGPPEDQAPPSEDANAPGVPDDAYAVHLVKRPPLEILALITEQIIEATTGHDEVVPVAKVTMLGWALTIGVAKAELQEEAEGK